MFCNEIDFFWVRNSVFNLRPTNSGAFLRFSLCSFTKIAYCQKQIRHADNYRSTSEVSG